ncbi:hypothetical protein PG999_014005 [Apiospora kogelbergensis]|uniref:Uncharacterized protein n=1 Tax=Apiospora kogelbergensis TaxID=1337665 RepID=A0AAW0Q7T7_9PEZI
MGELKHLWDELARNKANKSTSKKWGFTIYLTDYSNKILCKEYLKHLQSAIEFNINPLQNSGPVSDKKETDDPDDEKKKKKAPKKTKNTVIRNAFKFVVIKDSNIEGYTTAQVRQYHKQKIREYLDSEPHLPDGNERTSKKRKINHIEERPPAREKEAEEEPKCTELANQRKKRFASPKPTSPPKEKKEDQDEDQDGQDDEGKKTKEKTKRPPPREERFGQVWQDYFIHVDSAVLEKFQEFIEARNREARYLLHPKLHAYDDATRIVAIVGEAERSDYRLRGLSSWCRHTSVHDRSVPELSMDWQLVEASSLPALYDHLSRRPLGRAQLLAAPPGGGGDGGTELCRGPLNDGLYTTVGSLVIEAADHGPWYELFCFPPSVNSM